MTSLSIYTIPSSLQKASGTNISEFGMAEAYKVDIKNQQYFYTCQWTNRNWNNNEQYLSQYTTGKY